MNLNARELASVLAGLRMLQHQYHARQYAVDIYNSIATDGGSFACLSMDEIDELCERLNGEREPAQVPTKKVKRRRKPKKCPVCGAKEGPNNPLSFAPDPYASDVHGNDTPVWECRNCRHDSAMSI